MATLSGNAWRPLVSLHAVLWREGVRRIGTLQQHDGRAVCAAAERSWSDCRPSGGCERRAACVSVEQRRNEESRHARRNDQCGGRHQLAGANHGHEQHGCRRIERISLGRGSINDLRNPYRRIRVRRGRDQERGGRGRRVGGTCPSRHTSSCGHGILPSHGRRVQRTKDGREGDGH